jgi:uncharacterized glyoxalase superfamily protein PhnB
MILACSHLLLATDDVPGMTAFFSQAFEIAPHFANDMFSEFVLPSKFRLAFFTPVGASAKSFQAAADRGACAFGITVADADDVYRRMEALAAETTARPLQLSGPPKEHPWGEKSFLLTDMDGNRWEITQSPSPGGMLIER